MRMPDLFMRPAASDDDVGSEAVHGYGTVCVGVEQLQRRLRCHQKWSRICKTDLEYSDRNCVNNCTYIHVQCQCVHSLDIHV